MVPFNKPVNNIKYYMIIYKVLNSLKNKNFIFKVLTFLRIVCIYIIMTL